MGARKRLLQLQAQSAAVESTGLETAEIEYRTQMDNLEIERAAGLSKIESTKFKAIINAIGRETIAAIAQAGPEMQAKLLEGLGIKRLLITDGNSPINLFNTANGLITDPSQ